jgi:hemerythrin-like domain-containing protein
MKRTEHLEPLSHDHYAGLHVAMRLRKGLAKGAAADEMATFIVHFWDAYLVNHFRQEEELLVEPLQRTGGAELSARMTREHGQLLSLVDGMRETPGNALIEKFAALLPEHIRFEERELFPYLEEHLDAPTLAAIGNQLQAEHVDPDLSWPVEFWL